MTVQVRAALPSDADVLLDLIQRHAAYEEAKASITKPVLAGILATKYPPTQIFVAEFRKVLVGYAAVTFDYALWHGERFAHLDCLFVSETVRGQGIGKMLFQDSCRTARDASVKRIEWQTPAWNEDAIRFYIREGATGRPKRRFSMTLS